MSGGRGWIERRKLDGWMKPSVIVAVILAVAGGGFFVDDRFASSAEVDSLAKVVAKIDKRLDKKIITDQHRDAQDRLWRHERRYGGSCEQCDPEEWGRRREYQADEGELRRELAGP